MGGPDHPADPAGRDDLGVGDAGVRHRRRHRQQAGARRRRPGGGRPHRGRPYQLLDIGEVDADVVALNASAWGGPPIGALVFRDPAQIDTFGSVSTNPYASGPARLELGGHQYGLLAGVVASIEYPANLDDGQPAPGAKKLSTSMQSAGAYLSHLFDYMMVSLRSLPLVMVDRPPVATHPGGHVRRQRCARGAGGAADWPTMGSWPSATPTHAFST